MFSLTSPLSSKKEIKKSPKDKRKKRKKINSGVLKKEVVI
jgi:hypothetical protein